MALANHLKTKLTSLLARSLAARPARLAGHKPVASITFDDFPKNAWTQGGPVMARYGVKGTYYTAGGFCGRTENGTVLLIEPSAKQYVERGRFSQPDRSSSPAWAHPVIANGKLYVRDQGILFCYDVKAK